jgi:hypothetical protein
MTLNARHSTTYDNLKEYTEIISQYNNAGFCFVAGNPVYLSEEERQVDAKSRMRELVTIARSSLESGPIFIGSEGQFELAMELAAKYATIPFMLMDGSVQDQASRMLSNDTCNEIGLYCPYLLSESGNDELLIQTLGQYALRRKWVRQASRKVGAKRSDVQTQINEGQRIEEPARQILIDAIRTLALCDIGDFPDTLRKSSSIGVRYLAFLSALEDFDGEERFSDILSEAME